MDPFTQHSTFLTPATCFTIACVAFSIIAVTTVWRNQSASTLPKTVQESRPRPQRRVAVDSLYPETTTATHDESHESPLVVLAQLITQCAKLSDRLGHADDGDQQVAILLVELSTMTTSLCRLQQCICNNVNAIAPGTGPGVCFSAATSGLQATLRLLQKPDGRPATELSSMQCDEASRQLQAQRPALEFLVSTLSINVMPPTPPGDFERMPSFMGATEGRLTPGDSTPAQTPTGLTPAVDSKGWLEPPPEYSPPATSDSLPLAEKTANEQITPAPPAVQPRTEIGDTADDALYQVVTIDDTAALTDLLSLGLDPNAAIGEIQRTPLHQAAHLNHCTGLSILLRHGAVMSTEDGTGDMPLHLAAWAGHVEALSSLLAHGADVDWLSGRDGYSALWCAISAQHIDAARLLLKNGARVSLRSATGGGLMPLHQAAVMGQAAMCELLLERGAQVAATDDDLNTPLHYAAASGSAASVRVMLRFGADVEARQAQGLTAVHWSAHKGHTDVLALLMEYGAEIDCLADEGATPLHLAANRGHLPAARLLLEKGAQRGVVADAWDGTSGTAADMAKAKGHLQVAGVISGWGKD